MATDLDKFIQETTDYLNMRSKEAGLGSAKGLAQYGVPKKFGGLAQYGNTLKVKNLPGHAKDLQTAAAKQGKNLTPLKTSDIKNVDIPIKADNLKADAGTSLGAKTQATMAQTTSDLVRGARVAKAKEMLRSARANRQSDAAGGAAPTGDAAFKTNTALREKTKGMTGGDDDLARRLFDKHYGQPSLLEKYRSTDPKDMMVSARRAAMNMPHKKKIIGAGIVGGTAYAYKDAPQEARGFDPEAAEKSVSFASRENPDISAVMDQKPAGKPSGEDTAESASTMDKLTDYGKDAFSKIQDFASTRVGSGVIGATTGAGLAYLIDKMTTDGDEDEDKVRNRRIITSLLGALGGAAAGVGIQHYMGQQKTAMEEQNPAKVQSLLQQEAAALSDEALEQKVTELEMKEKTASYTDFIHRRLCTVFQPQFAS